MGSGRGPTRGSHEETLALVRRLPTTLAGWVQSRPVAAVPGMRRAFKRTWAEVRGSTLLLYAVPPYSTASTADEVAADTAPDAVALIGLKDCKVKMDAARFRLKTKHPVPGDAGAGALAIGIELQLADRGMTVSWNGAISAAGTTRAIGLSDFEVLKPIGRGASGRVFLVREKNGDEDLALKVIEKESVYENDDAFRHALDERMVLELACDHPFILKMRHAFQTSKRLYIVTEFAKGGDLFDFLKKRGKPFTEQIVVRMAGEMLLALQHIHKLGVVYVCVSSCYERLRGSWGSEEEEGPSWLPWPFSDSLGFASESVADRPFLVSSATAGAFAAPPLICSASVSARSTDSAQVPRPQAGERAAGH